MFNSDWAKLCCCFGSAVSLDTGWMTLYCIVFAFPGRHIELRWLYVSVGRREGRKMEGISDPVQHCTNPNATTLTTTAATPCMTAITPATTAAPLVGNGPSAISAAAWWRHEGGDAPWKKHPRIIVDYNLHHSLALQSNRERIQDRRRLRCHLCYCRNVWTNTSHMCQVCDVLLCVLNCFRMYHTKLNIHPRKEKRKANRKRENEKYTQIHTNIITPPLKNNGFLACTIISGYNYPDGRSHFWSVMLSSMMNKCEYIIFFHIFLIIIIIVFLLCLVEHFSTK